MSGKKIYSNELKLQVIERYLKGSVSIRDVANEFVVGASDVRKWKDAYKRAPSFKPSDEYVR